ncbi:hypothetical protein LOTGIDRAFT_133634 [Lottia gigantea]|uniref:Ammonium transporter AmtB-like domain-containing protein n=1 Tax=Lottia gigantea TaxID=225164 RepID=V4B4N2_LOTGI|nr:hypothetical protein LOTGIDRAFT_133634 [Lottia gigantea]ESO83379.1 hypothetical protein LOTGIDRAFT_133634 [Lottia gigantea]
MRSPTRLKFPIVVLGIQIIFIVLFALTVEYDKSADAKFDIQHPRNVTDRNPPENEVSKYYPMFQDVHVMIFIGFGFLMTFLKRYGFSAVGLNLLIAALILQWATLVQGYLHSDGNVHISITSMITADFAAATVLITFGAVLGKVSPLQMVVVALIEVVLATLNEKVGVQIFQVSDIGGSIFVHAFGAFFGLALARVLYDEDVERSTKEGSVYHSDLFAMIGTIFLWLFWPSFNSALAVGDDQHRAVLNTYMALAACCIVTFAISALVDGEGKFDMVHVQNATLAGGVAVGTSADMMIQPVGALVVGAVAGVLSTCGYRFITPFLTSKLKLHDTCGVNNLHGMPAVLAAVIGSIAAAVANTDTYDDPEFAKIKLYVDVSPGEGRTAGQQGGYQMLALAVTLAIAIVGGVITGFIIKFIPMFVAPKKEQLFEDEPYWGVPDDHRTYPNIPIIITTEATDSHASVPSLYQHVTARLLESDEPVNSERHSNSSLEDEKESIENKTADIDV